MDEKRISLKIDVRSGTIELDAPADTFDQAVAKTKELTASLDFGRSPLPAADDAAISTPDDGEREQVDAAPLPRARVRSTKASSARLGRLGSFEEVKGLLSEQQHRDLRKFFSEKAPREQTHQVLVGMVKGEELLGRRGFGYNEIYTLMWLGGVKPLPKALDVVLLRLAQDQMAVREDSGFSVKFLGREFVENELPKPPDK